MVILPVPFVLPVKLTTAGEYWVASPIWKVLDIVADAINLCKLPFT